jgi:glycosyltransferase involved in cell wall biosynthesis
LYPYTVGGGERWYRSLAEGLARRGHTVTYLTRLQWNPEQSADVPGVEVIAVAPSMDLYVHGRRSISVQLRFAIGVFRHLVRHGRRYDIVQTPALHASLLAVLAAQLPGRFRVVVDWFEVWTRDYWLQYLGGLGGRFGWWAERVMARSRGVALCFSKVHAGRLKELGHRGPIVQVEGLSELSDEDAQPVPAEPVVVFAGRHIPEKNAPAVVRAVALAREEIPELRGTIFGDGPDRAEVLRLIESLGLDDAITVPGFADAGELRETLRRALCQVFPSMREGYGLVVVEAASVGTPTVVVRTPDNAAVELVDDGENGVVVESAEPEELAAAILRVQAAGDAMRRSTAAWFWRNRARLSLESTLEKLEAVYGR